MTSLTGNPIDRLLLLAEQATDRDLGEWLAAAVLQHVAGGESLDRCLGLAGDLGRSPRYEFLRRRRDAHLRAALAGLGGDERALAVEVSHYLTRVPAHIRDRLTPPADWPAWRRAIHQAARTVMDMPGLGLPATAKGLRKALNPGNRTPSVPFRAAA